MKHYWDRDTPQVPTLVSELIWWQPSKHSRRKHRLGSHEPWKLRRNGRSEGGVRIFLLRQILPHRIFLSTSCFLCIRYISPLEMHMLAVDAHHIRDGSAHAPGGEPNPCLCHGRSVYIQFTLNRWSFSVESGDMRFRYALDNMTSWFEYNEVVRVALLREFVHGHTLGRIKKKPAFTHTISTPLHQCFRLFHEDVFSLAELGLRYFTYCILWALPLYELYSIGLALYEHHLLRQNRFIYLCIHVFIILQTA